MKKPVKPVKPWLGPAPIKPIKKIIKRNLLCTIDKNISLDEIIKSLPDKIPYKDVLFEYRQNSCVRCEYCDNGYNDSYVNVYIDNIEIDNYFYDLEIKSYNKKLKDHLNKKTDYENKLKQYKENLQKYKDECVLYEDWSKKEEIKKLEARLNKLKK